MKWFIIFYWRGLREVIQRFLNEEFGWIEITVTTRGVLVEWHNISCTKRLGKGYNMSYLRTLSDNNSYTRSFGEVIQQFLHEISEWSDTTVLIWRGYVKWYIIFYLRICIMSTWGVWVKLYISSCTKRLGKGSRFSYLWKGGGEVTTVLIRGVLVEWYNSYYMWSLGEVI